MEEVEGVRNAITTTYSAQGSGSDHHARHVAESEAESETQSASPSDSGSAFTQPAPTPAFEPAEVSPDHTTRHREEALPPSTAPVSPPETTLSGELGSPSFPLLAGDFETAQPGSGAESARSVVDSQEASAVDGEGDRAGGGAGAIETVSSDDRLRTSARTEGEPPLLNSEVAGGKDFPPGDGGAAAATAAASQRPTAGSLEGEEDGTKSDVGSATNLAAPPAEAAQASPVQANDAGSRASGSEGGNSLRGGVGNEGTVARGTAASADVPPGGFAEETAPKGPESGAPSSSPPPWRGQSNAPAGGVAADANLTTGSGPNASSGVQDVGGLNGGGGLSQHRAGPASSSVPVDAPSSPLPASVSGAQGGGTSSTSTSSSSSSGGGGSVNANLLGGSASIFKPLTQKIKSLELNQSLLEGYVQDLNRKILADFEEFARELEGADGVLTNITAELAKLAATVAEQDERAAMQQKEWAVEMQRSAAERCVGWIAGRSGLTFLNEFGVTAIEARQIFFSLDLLVRLEFT